MMVLFSKTGMRLDMMQEMFRQTGAASPCDKGFDTVPSLRQAIYRCASCTKMDACRKWLDIGLEKNLENRTVPKFCANSDLQNELKS